MKFIKTLIYDQISLWLLFLSIVSVIGYFTKELNITPFLAIIAMDIIYNVNERRKFINRIIDAETKYPGLLKTLDLNIKSGKTTLKNIGVIECIAFGLIIGGQILMAIIIAIKFIS